MTHRYRRKQERVASSNQILIMQHISKFFPSRENNVILPVACLTGCSRADRNTFGDCRGMFVSMCVGERQRERQICHFFISVVWWGWQRMCCICFTIPHGTHVLRLALTHIQAPSFAPLPLSLTTLASFFNYILNHISCAPLHTSCLLCLSFQASFPITPFVHLQTGLCMCV